MSEFHERGQASEHAKALNLKATHAHGLFNTTITDTRGQTQRINAEHAFVNLQSDCTSRQNPTSPTPISLIDGGVSEYRLDKGSIDNLDHIYLRYDLFNDSANPVSVTNSSLSLASIQVFAQNGADLLYQETGLQHWLSLGMQLSVNEWTQMNARFGSNATYTSGISIPAGVTRSFYLPVTRLIAQAKLCLAGLTSEIVLRFNFNQATLNVAGAVVPKCTDAYLLLRGSYEPTDITKSKIALYKSPQILTIPYLHPQNMNQTLTLTANSDYSIVLSGITGLVAMVAFVIRQSPIPNLNLGNFLDIVEKFDVQNPSGESLTGHYQMADDESRQLLYPEKFDNLFNANSNFIVIPFCKSPSKVLKHGVIDGYNHFDGFNKLVFKTSPGLATASYQVDILAWVYSTCHINRGTVRSRKP